VTRLGEFSPLVDFLLWPVYRGREATFIMKKWFGLYLGDFFSQKI
jgi:hypothetical protein